MHKKQIIPAKAYSKSNMTLNDCNLTNSITSSISKKVKKISPSSISTINNNNNNNNKYNNNNHNSTNVNTKIPIIPIPVPIIPTIISSTISSTRTTCIKLFYFEYIPCEVDGNCLFRSLVISPFICYGNPIDLRCYLIQELIHQLQLNS